MQKILLTRSVEENQILSKEVAALGFEPLFAPMTSYEATPIDFSQFRDGLDIIITSKFAAKIIAEQYPYKANCFVVGYESANILRQNPKLNISDVADNAELLYRHCEEHVVPRGNLIPHKGIAASPKRTHRNNGEDDTIYFSGNIITREFEYAKRIIIYKVEYIDNLDEATINALKSDIKYILLYSKNCCENLILVLKRYNLLQNIQNSVVIAMSSNLASGCAKYVSDILFPDKPQASEILKLLVEYDREKKYREIAAGRKD